MNVYNLQRKISRREEKVTSLTDLHRQLTETNVLNAEAAKNLEIIFNSPISELIKRFIGDKIRGKIARGAFPPEIKQFATSVFFFSPVAYEEVRKFFDKSLPAPETIRKWYSAIESNPGFQKACFDFMKNMTTEMSPAGEILERRIKAGLSLDGMSIKKRIQQVGKKVYGYVDYGLNDCSFVPKVSGEKELATQALNFVTVPMDISFKLPTSYFFVHAPKAELQSNLVKESLIRHHDANIDVITVTFDGHRTNLATAENLGANLDFSDPEFKPFITHPVTSEKVFMILDPSHAVKLVRNCLEALGQLLSPDGLIDFKFIKKLLEIMGTINCDLGTKLTKHHVDFHNDPMKVRLAVQLLSKSVADALEFLMTSLPNDKNPFKNATATIIFIRTFNTAFDMLNSMMKNAKDWKAPITQKNLEAWCDKADEICGYIEKIQTTKKQSILISMRKTGFLGFYMDLKNVKMMAIELFGSESPPTEIKTYFLSQDHLEMMNGALRKGGGCSNNPMSHQFMTRMKMLFCAEQIKMSKGNCELLQHVPILQVHRALSNKNFSSHLMNTTTTSEPNDESDMAISEKDDPIELIENVLLKDYKRLEVIVGSENASLLNQNAIGLTAGLVLDLIIAKTKCSDCVLQCIDDETNSRKFKLLKFKRPEFQPQPSEDLFKICSIADKTFRTFIKTKGESLLSDPKFDEIIVNRAIIELQSQRIFDTAKIHMRDHPNHYLLLLKSITSFYVQIKKKAAINSINIGHNKLLRQKLTRSVNLQNQ